MKSTADGVPRRSEAQMAIARSRARQVWAVLFIVLAAIAALFGLRLNKKAPPKQPSISFSTVIARNPGMVGEVLVQPGQYVRKGELLAVMDYGHLEAQREMAEQNLEAVLEQASAGNEAIALPPPPAALRGRFEKKAVPLPPAMPPVQTNNIQVAPPPPQKPLVLPPAKGKKAAGSKSPKSGSKALSKAALPAAVKNANVPSAASASSAPDDSASVKTLQAKVDSDKAQIQSLTKQIPAQQDAATQAQSLVVSLSTMATRTKADSDKSATLLAEGVISANEAAKSQSYNMQAQGQLQQAKIKAAAAQAALGQTQGQLDDLNKELPKDEDALKEAESAAAEARKHPKPVILPTPLTAPALPPAGGAAETPKYRLEPVKGPIAGPPPKPLQVDFVSLSQVIQKILVAEKALEDAQAQFADACIYANADGTVTRISIRPGQMLTPGTAAFVLKK